MTTTIKLIVLALAIFAILYIVKTKGIGSAPSVKVRLKGIKSNDRGNDEDTASFVERLVKPIYDNLYELFSRFTPNGVEEVYSDLLIKAGMSNDYTVTKIVTNQVLLAVIVALASSILMVKFAGVFNVRVFVLLVAASIYLPFSNLRGKAKKRQDRIRKSLPNILDMIYISVEAGLSFDAAMVTTSSKMKNELSVEIGRAMSEISRGRIREEALYSISDRTQVDDVRSFISTIVQSEKLGSDISNVLRIQAEVMRDKHKQHAEETINKMPVKMLLPLIFLLLPSLFVVIMGPAILNVISGPLGSLF